MENTSFKIGKKYLIRTVTQYYTGRLIAITETDLLLEDAAWIADTGRYHNALRAGMIESNCEIEPYINPVLVSRGGIIDATTWDHELPRVQQ